VEEPSAIGQRGPDVTPAAFPLGVLHESSNIVLTVSVKVPDPAGLLCDAEEVVPHLAAKEFLAIGQRDPDVTLALSTLGVPDEGSDIILAVAVEVPDLADLVADAEEIVPHRTAFKPLAIGQGHPYVTLAIALLGVTDKGSDIVSTVPVEVPDQAGLVADAEKVVPHRTADEPSTVVRRVHYYGNSRIHYNICGEGHSLGFVGKYRRTDSNAQQAKQEQGRQWK
jgi:hypothetical protein